MPGLTEDDWKRICERIDDGKLTPFISSRVCRDYLPGAERLVNEWAKKEAYPFSDERPSISQLARFVSTRSKEKYRAHRKFIEYQKERLHTSALPVDSSHVPSRPLTQRDLRKLRLSEIAGGLGCLKEPAWETSPFRILAELPLSVYVTTSYFDFLEQALRITKRAARQESNKVLYKEPYTEVCYWRDELRCIEALGNAEQDLLGLLKEGFNKEQVKDLAFKVNVDHEGLPVDGPGGLERELIRECERRKQLANLVLTAAEERPGPQWYTVFKAMGLPFKGSDTVGIPSIYQKEPDYQPSIDRPLVYHLYGIETEPASLVLTEDDYIEFLVQVFKKVQTLAPPVDQALTDSSLLLIGYDLHDLEFSVLFRGLIMSRRDSRRGLNVCLQYKPDSRYSGISSLEDVKDYMERYFDMSNFHLYWGKPEQFLQDLKARFDNYQQH